MHTRSPGEVLSEGLVIVLVNPIHPGNVGATARAMANLGLEQLVLVDPPCFDLERARWMASSGGRVILDKARIVATVEEALADCSFAIGATARKRRWRWPVLEPPQLAERAFTQERKTAVLFGREDSGLDNASLALCQALLRIPTASEPSLNLSQAVLMVSSAMFDQARALGWSPDQPQRQGKRSGGAPVKATPRRESPPADLPRQQRVVQELLDVLERTPYAGGWSREQVQVSMSMLLQRAVPTHSELDILQGMLNKTRWRLDNPDKG